MELMNHHFFVSETNGIEQLKKQGIIVEQIKEVISEIEEVNKHIK